MILKFVFLFNLTSYDFIILFRTCVMLRDGPFDIQGGWDFFEKNSFHRSEKNKMSSTKLKINSLFFIQQILIEALFPSELYRFANNT